jgi:hypothetical protein
MASIDANVSPDKGQQDSSPARRCENCDHEMMQLGAFPAIAGRVAVVIFRCYGCNLVASEDR